MQIEFCNEYKKSSFACNTAELAFSSFRRMLKQRENCLLLKDHFSPIDINVLELVLEMNAQIRVLFTSCNTK